jgi:hypothetical protein
MISDLSRKHVIGTATVAGALLALCTLAAQPVQVHPPSGPGGPIVVAVLADNFTVTERKDFEEATANLFTYGLFADSVLDKSGKRQPGFYRTHQGAFTVKTFFEPVKAHGSSRYGFVLAPRTNCSISWDDKSTPVEVERAAANVPGATHIVVIGNHDYTFGCKHDNWVYIATGAVGQQVLHHEFGHLIAGLYDEFALPDFETLPHPNAPIKRLNCSTDVAQPHWESYSGKLDNLLRCGLYGLNIIHPQHRCLMGAHGDWFCVVCKREMEKEIQFLQNPRAFAGSIASTGGSPLRVARISMAVSGPGHARSSPMTALRTAAVQPSPQEAPLLRLLIQVPSKADGAIRVLSATDSKGVATVRNRPLGDFVYEVRDRGRTLVLGVVPGNPFETRAYSGGLPEHRAKPDEPTATILIMVPNETRGQILAEGRMVEVAIYQLDATFDNTPVTPATLIDLNSKGLARVHAQLSAADFRSQILKLAQ